MKYEILNPKINNNIKNISSKMKVNPYFGCEHKCLFCPANDGYLKRQVFNEFSKTGTIFIVDNIIDHIKEYISASTEKTTVHLSPVADPFQPAEKIFGKSQKIVSYCLENDIPIAICTKGIIPDAIIEQLSGHKESFVQLSLMSYNEKKRSFIVRGKGATVEETLRQIDKLVLHGVNTLIRVDPIFPYITDNMEEFGVLVRKLSEKGITSITSSCADILEGSIDKEANYLDSYGIGMANKYRELYCDKIQGRYHANIEYRKNLFDNMSRICKDIGIGFGITWEPDLEGNSLSPIYSHGSEKFLEKIQ